MARKLEKYRREIFEGLEREYAASPPEMTVELDDLKLILFSDLHRGARDGADDFQRCERAYNAALAYYYRAGYTLCLLGDAEDLWECQASTVVANYEHSFELEGQFRAAGRYIRILGNHDDLWSDPKAVKRYLGRFGLDEPVRRSVRIEVRDDGARLGELFLVHGHQGTRDSDKLSAFSRLFVRYVWRNVQRLTHIPSTRPTPSEDWRLRQNHDAAMYRWALSKREAGLILFAGHTHRPVFKGESKVDRLSRKIRELEQKPGSPENLAQLQALAAELEWVRASEFQTPPAIEMEAPCYFNTGCSSFGDGDVTGLELAAGEIKLVRLPDNAGKPIPEVLSKEQPAYLRDCFEWVRGSRRMPLPGVPEHVLTQASYPERERPAAPH